jgi:CHAT domain-containing protein
VSGDYAGARPLYERARISALAQAHARADLGDDAQRALQREASGGLSPYVGMLAAIAREPAKYPGADSASADAFVVVEQARAGAAHTALARAAARVAAGDATTATLAREVEDLRDRLQTTRRQVVAEHGRPPGQRDRAGLPVLQARAEEIQHDLKTALARLRAAFPRYGELAAPDPIDVTTTGRLLRSDEALLSVFALDDRVLLWLLRPGRPPVYHDREVSRSDLARLVRQVRASLDQSAGADLDAGRLAPFDVAGSAKLYRLLVEPVVSALTDVRHLIVVPDDVILPLPFGALVMSAEGEAYRELAELFARQLAPAPADLAQYARLPWLTQRYAVTVLPSATALRALRQTPRTRVAAAEPLIGFGDPVLEGTGGQRGGTMLAARGAAASMNDLRKLDRLPGTREELLALAKAFGVEPQAAVYLGARATKPEVLRLDADGRLGKARVLAFATHGLVGGEVKGLRQPALVLTPPATPSEQDDGLLSLDDIVGLSLAAEWVVLSACNTAAADGSGEGLSGARARVLLRRRAVAAGLALERGRPRDPGTDDPSVRTVRQGAGHPEDRGPATRDARADGERSGADGVLRAPICLGAVLPRRRGELSARW